MLPPPRDIRSKGSNSSARKPGGTPSTDTPSTDTPSTDTPSAGSPSAGKPGASVGGDSANAAGQPPSGEIREGVAREVAGLTERQDKILRYVQEFQVQNGFPPSIREIGEYFGIRSTNGVSDHLRALERKGFLQRSGHLSRSLTVVRGADEVVDSRPEVVPYDLREPEVRERVIQRDDDAELSGGDLPANVRRLRPDRQVRPTVPDSHAQSQMVPVLGKVAAGLPLLAVEEAEETLVVDRFLLGGGPGEVFALRVVGESMIEAGILPGDYLFVRRRDTAQNGEIAVVLLNGEATVKRWFPEGDVIRLQPENRTMQPIYVRRGDHSQCRVVGVVAGVYRRM